MKSFVLKALIPDDSGSLRRMVQFHQYIERKIELVSKCSLSEEPTIRKEFKLEFNMSVSQFAYFIRTFIETGVIQNKNISELIRFLARFAKNQTLREYRL